MKHSNARTSNPIIWLGLILVSVLVFQLITNLYLTLSCLRPDSGNERQAKAGQLTSKQRRQLRDFIFEDIRSTHPYHSYAFGYDAYKRNFACVEVHMGRDLRLHRTPNTDRAPSDYDENWAMVYFWGQWWKLGANRFND